MGSFVPWLYYAFYCEKTIMLVYLILILFLGTSCIVVSLWEKFGTSEYRAMRAGISIKILKKYPHMIEYFFLINKGMFIALGLSALIPASHFCIKIGVYKAWNVGELLS